MCSQCVQLHSSDSTCIPLKGGSDFPVDYLSDDRDEKAYENYKLTVIKKVLDTSPPSTTTTSEPMEETTTSVSKMSLSNSDKNADKNSDWTVVHSERKINVSSKYSQVKTINKKGKKEIVFSQS